MKDKLIKLSELGVDQIFDLIELSKEIESELQNSPIHGWTMKDLQILKEVQSISRLAEEIRKAIVSSRSIGVETHRSLVVAKLQLLQLI